VELPQICRKIAADRYLVGANLQHSPEYFCGLCKLSLLRQYRAQASQHILVGWGQLCRLAQFGFSLPEFSGASELKSALCVGCSFVVLVRKERRILSGSECAKARE
jgi:hypothetical protein